MKIFPTPADFFFHTTLFEFVLVSEKAIKNYCVGDYPPRIRSCLGKCNKKIFALWGGVEIHPLYMLGGGGVETPPPYVKLGGSPLLKVQSGLELS